MLPTYPWELKSPLLLENTILLIKCITLGRDKLSKKTKGACDEPVRLDKSLGIIWVWQTHPKGITNESHPYIIHFSQCGRNLWCIFSQKNIAKVMGCHSHNHPRSTQQDRKHPGAGEFPGSLGGQVPIILEVSAPMSPPQKDPPQPSHPKHVTSWSLSMPSICFIIYVHLSPSAVT